MSASTSTGNGVGVNPSGFKTSAASLSHPLVRSALAATSNGAIICPGHSRPVPDLSFMFDQQDGSDGYLLISSCLDNKAMIRDGLTGDWIGTFIGHKGAVWCSRLSSDATRAATGSADFSAKLWDASNGDCLHTFQHKHIVKSVTFDQHQRNVLYTGGHERLLRSYDLNSYDAAPQQSNDVGASINSVINLPQPHMLAVASNSNDVAIYDTRTMTTPVKSVQTPSTVTSMQLSLTGDSFVISSGQQVLTYNSSDYSLQNTLNLERPITCVAYNDLLKRYVTGSNTELWVHIYDQQGTEIGINKGHHGPARCLAYAPHGYTYASGSEDGTIRLWSFADIKLSDNDVKEIDNGLRAAQLTDNSEGKAMNGHASETAVAT